MNDPIDKKGAESLLKYLLGDSTTKRIAEDTFAKIKVSTAQFSETDYETALLTSGGECFPVARATNNEEAEKQHKEVVDKITSGQREWIRVGLGQVPNMGIVLDLSLFEETNG